MIRLIRLLLFGLVVVAFGAAETPPKASHDPEAVAQLVLSIYREAGPKLGCKFVEADLVITLAGLRATNECWTTVTPASQEDEQRLKQLAPILEPRGLRLVTKWDERQQILHFGVISLEGLERVTRESHLPEVVPFQSTQGWPGFELYKKTLTESVRKDPGKSDGAADLVRGLYLGYPDRALLDFATAVRGRPVQIARIGWADYYECPEPRWEMTNQSLKDPQVLEIEARWSQFLERFYASPSHQLLAKEKDFLAARRGNVLCHQAWLEKYRDIHKFPTSRERIRLGLVKS
ncbi:hypothetical protein IV102_37865 [bacterium]|nr:hypothetical protein [bacterium]